MTDKYDVYDVTAIASILEQLGTKEKFWFKGYWDGFDDNWLFKYSRDNTGEHWSEKAAESICYALGLPHAIYHLAKSIDRPGVITKNLIPSGNSMIMGNQLLHSMNPTVYPEPNVASETFMHVTEHTISSIFEAFNEYGVLPPNEFKNNEAHTPYNMVSPEGLDASDVFCGYLLLDALISNQDRHHENWAIIETLDDKRFLCPTFDHAASLGRELTDNERKERLNTNDSYRKVDHFVTRAKSEIYASSGNKERLSTIDAFFESVKKRQNAKSYWLSRLRELSDEKVISIFRMMPNYAITQVARDFGVAMILANKKRLLKDERA